MCVRHTPCAYPRTTDTQWRHKSKISEKLGRCGRWNMFRPYLKIWDWDWICGRAVKAISSLGVRSLCYKQRSGPLYYWICPIDVCSLWMIPERGFICCSNNMKEAFSQLIITKVSNRASFYVCLQMFAEKWGWMSNNNQPTTLPAAWSYLYLIVYRQLLF